MANRRDFLKGIATVGAASSLGAAANAKASEAPTQTGEKLAAAPPSSREEAMEWEVPDGYSETEAEFYFVKHAGSDFMVDVVKSLGIDYLASNPGSSFRGFHESVVNYGGNSKPEFLTCLHEESAVALAHGYAKIAGKLLAVACHGTVGLQHASMAIYNAWCDRAPVVVLAGNHLDATERRAGVEWSHSVQDAAKIVRDFVKWDDTPMSLPHFAESLVRAYKIAMTPPMGPVVIVMDAHLQEQEVGSPPPKLPALSPTVPPQGDRGALREAAELLVSAERPVILADRAARTAEGMTRLVALAEVLQAPVVDRAGRLNFPTNHHLNHTGRAGRLVSQADVILGLELYDFWGNVNNMRDLIHREAVRTARDGAKLISLGVNDLFIKSNYQSFQRYMPVDLSISGDAEATLPSLTEEVKRAMSDERRAQNTEREASLREAYRTMKEQAKVEATYAWNASPISTARLCMELWQQIRHRDWSMVSRTSRVGSWPQRLWKMDRHYQFIGGSGGAGVGYGAPAAAGAALANREHGRLSVNMQADGDMMYAPGVLWTSAHHGIPLLSIVHNNRAYHQEVMHLQRMAARRQRGADGRAKIGNTFEDPFIGFAEIARGMGVWSEGPISDPEQLGPAIARAIDVVDRGEPALLDVISQPR
jgi:acetolactate synthase-1/2/3 large subunit